MSALDEFRAQVSNLLTTYLIARPAVEQFVWGEGSDDVAIFSERRGDAELSELNAARVWQALKFHSGFGWIDGPKEYGGAGLSQDHLCLFAELEGEFEHPDLIFFSVGHGMVGPTILREGSEHAKRTYLQPIYSGEILCCQLFSEPDAGSDLASVKTVALRDCEEWVVTGQKVWTSGAHYSDIGLLLARTSAETERHHGLTMFLVDMRAPGVEIRPLRQLTGGAHFNEVFLSEVRVPDDCRLGDVGEGWRVAVETLNQERASLRPGGANAVLGHIPFERLLESVRHFAVTSSPDVRDKLAKLYSLKRIGEFNASRLIATGRTGPELSICKMLATEIFRLTSDVMSRVLGCRMTADTGEWGTYAWCSYFLGVPGMRIGGGTDEIQRNILAERVLGLPR